MLRLVALALVASLVACSGVYHRPNTSGAERRADYWDCDALARRQVERENWETAEGRSTAIVLTRIACMEGRGYEIGKDDEETEPL